MIVMETQKPVRFFNQTKEVFVPKDFCIDFSRQLKAFGFSKEKSVKDLSEFAYIIESGFSDMNGTDEAKEWFYTNYNCCQDFDLQLNS